MKLLKLVTNMESQDPDDAKAPILWGRFGQEMWMMLKKPM